MKTLLLLLLVLIFVACDTELTVDKSDAAVEVVALPGDTVFPVTLEGTLELDIEEGEVGDDGISEYNFGALMAADGIYLVYAHGSVIRSSKFSRGDHVEAVITISGSDEINTGEDMPTYQISKIEMK